MYVIPSVCEYTDYTLCRSCLVRNVHTPA